MSSHRIDFKYVRDHASIEAVLAAYGIALQKDGGRPGQHKCLCPFHDDHKPSMKVNTDRNIYHCFVCDEGGNILDLVMQLEGADIRAAAKQVAETCGIDTSAMSARKQRGRKSSKGSSSAAGGRERSSAKQGRSQRNKAGNAESKSASDESAGRTDESQCNKPLTFELKNLITDHPFIAERGISEAMQAEFGIGVATRGIMKGRLVFPIHNAKGELVAYCGRLIGSEPLKDEPKYKLPPNFRKELELFNWHRVKDLATERPLVIVESYFSVVKLHGMEVPCVSPMGRTLSETQLSLLKGAGIKQVTLLFDGDDPGRTAIITAGRQLLAADLAATAPVVPEGFKPHKASAEELRTFLGC